MSKDYRICSRCVMDTSVPEITFNDQGECNFCTEFLARHKEHHAGKSGELDQFVAQIKRDGKGKDYDCIVGVSGGVDSSYSLYLAKSLGLRVLAVHMDNGWNSELASNNIENLVRSLGVDLYTHVIDWEEYRDLMESFFKANVVDVELLYDNAMNAVNFEQASRFNVNYILAGTNSSTEGMQIPVSWNWFKYDAKNIRSIHKAFGTKKIKTMPLIGAVDLARYLIIKKIRWVSFLDYFNYNKGEAMALLQKDFAYKPYPYKHYESIFTRFYQGYILPNKFGVDKRRVHLSNLLCTDQITRDEALQMLEEIPYPSQKYLEEDIEYFLKKMGWSRERLEQYISEPAVSHLRYGSEKKLYDLMISTYKKVRSS